MQNNVRFYSNWKALLLHTSSVFATFQVVRSFTIVAINQFNLICSNNSACIVVHVACCAFNKKLLNILELLSGEDEGGRDGKQTVKGYTYIDCITKTTVAFGQITRFILCILFFAENH